MSDSGKNPYDAPVTPAEVRYRKSPVPLLAFILATMLGLGVLFFLYLRMATPIRTAVPVQPVQKLPVNADE